MSKMPSLKWKHATLLVLVVFLGGTLTATQAVRTARTRHATSLEDLDNEPMDLFRMFVERHGKVYKDESERQQRYDNFVENLELAKAFNARTEGGSTTYGITKFSDWSEKEFSEKVLMRKQAGARPPRQGYLPVKGDLKDAPASWDWRDHGAVTPVKNQGTVGTCWAFSAVGNIEGQYALVDGNLESLSVEQVTDCDGGSFPNNRTGDCQVFGGWPFLAYEYVIRVGGLELDSDYPYCMLNETCWPCAPPGWNSTICGPPQPYCKKEDSCHFDPSLAAAKISSWVSLSSNEEELKAQLHQHGPVSIAIDATSLYIYWGGIVEGHLCSSDPADVDHAVLLVGYGTAKTRWGHEEDYWLVKNSWGSDWGENGYFRMRRGSNTCGVANYATTSII
ncbi:papain cysteine protease [Chloropicon primus]|uniref:Papain cysteine protease n=1 Tax=Chloropicon primus TaxID=1764295 RepID=A0A5B8N006_9CHLO|nr:papain cysteine protease [Chloropicon primus]UPR04329.1 papain cysteine protease [Chloropicon primus]|eukprot:QDZ25120.1 papain cysteine protease [Chloropicon primus]